ncbi:hypothetical protein BH10BAC5_BH10BAC5_07570 [soil metagenome]
MPIKSIDPRITRANINLNEKEPEEVLKPMGHWQTYECFHQGKRGEHHVHVGSLHAPNDEMAVILAKEQFGRRSRCVNIWVVKTSSVFTFDIDDEDIFLNNIEKSYREASGYKVMDKINKYKKEHKAESK